MASEKERLSWQARWADKLGTCRQLHLALLGSKNTSWQQACGARMCVYTRRAPPHQVRSVNEGVRHSDAVCRPQQSVDLHACKRTNSAQPLRAAGVTGSLRHTLPPASAQLHYLSKPQRPAAPTCSHTHTDTQSARCCCSSAHAPKPTPTRTPCAAATPCRSDYNARYSRTPTMFMMAKGR